jgi:hypothetical protein
MTRAMNIIDNFVIAVGGTTAVSMANAVPALVGGKMSGRTVYHMIISVDGDACMWRGDGTAPTAAVGHPIEDGQTLSLTGANFKSMIRTMQFIAVASTCQIFGTAFD